MSERSSSLTYQGSSESAGQRLRMSASPRLKGRISAIRRVKRHDSLKKSGIFLKVKTNRWSQRPLGFAKDIQVIIRQGVLGTSRKNLIRFTIQYSIH